MRTEKISYLSPDWFSFDNHVLVGGGDKEVHNSSQLLMINRISAGGGGGGGVTPIYKVYGYVPL